MTNNVEVHISSLLAEDEWKILRLFCEKVKRLAGTKLVQTQINSIRCRISFTQENGLSFSAEVPSEELIAEFLLAFRFFYLKNEPTHFPKILGIIGKHTTNEEVRQALRLFGKKWNDSLFQRALNITYNDMPVTSSLLLDLWFNAHYFHQDEEKRRELDKLIEGFSENFAKYMLLDSSITATNEVFKFSEIVHAMVDKHFNSD
jgi:hypothetical protein